MKREKMGWREMAKFFNRPGQHVVNDLAFTWIKHNQEKLHDGKGSILAIINRGRVRLFNVALATLYTDVDTRKRFPQSRALEIEALEPGTMICYKYRSTKLVFIKTQNTENIGLVELEEIDRQGNPLPNQKEMRGGKITQLIGLSDRKTARLVPFLLDGKRGFKVVVEKKRRKKDRSVHHLRQIEKLILQK
ncbi:hypothetical protein HY041_02625 [Candidatus Roizmanbacteria bacterium]|nr:hypothetical protein [Candidatus Roizmanbacteria bacterium]